MWLTGLDQHSEVTMRIGIGTYALFWEWNERNPDPISIEGMVDRAAELQCDVFQICDDPRLDSYDDEALRKLAGHASKRNVELELGTRGTSPEHLREFIHKAQLLNAHTLRSMVQAPEVAAGVHSVVANLQSQVSELERADVTLALETYEQVSTKQLVKIVRGVDSSRIGICLDPANCVSALEYPNDVIEMTSELVTNLHVKDFAFSRNAGWVGFLYAGAEIGQGMLDLDRELKAVYADGRSPAAIVEHWVPWQGDIDTTVEVERRWTHATLTALRARRNQYPTKS